MKTKPKKQSEYAPSDMLSKPERRAVVVQLLSRTGMAEGLIRVGLGNFTYGQLAKRLIP